MAHQRDAAPPPQNEKIPPDAGMRTTRRAYALGRGTAVLSALVVTAFTLLGMAQERRVAAGSIRIQLAREVLELTLARENAIRGYLLTADSSMLSRDAGRRTSALAKLDSLRRLTPEQSDEAPLVRAVVEHLADWDSHNAGRLAAERAANVGAVSAVTNTGRERFNEVSRPLNELIRQEQIKWDSARAAATTAERAMPVVAIVAFGLLLAALARVRYIVLSQVLNLELQRRELVLGNETLLTRTRELEVKANELQSVNRRLEQAHAVASDTAREQAALFAAMPDTVVVLDRDGQYLKVERSSDHPGGPSRTDRIGRRVHDLFPAEPADRIVDLVRSALHANATQKAEVAVPFTDGNLWFETTAVPLDRGRVLCVARDITERKRNEMELRHRNERFQLLARATNEVVFEIDFATRRVEWNDAIFTTLRFARGQMSDRLDAWLERVHPDDLEKVVAMWSSSMKEDGAFWTLEYRFRRGDDTYATVLSRGSVQRDGDGRPLRMIGSLLDLTERYALESRLRQSQKMEAIGQLAGGVAHDFNNLLTVISSYAALVQETSDLQADDREALTEIESAARRAAELTRQLLTFSRQRLFEPRMIDLNETVHETERLLSRLLPASIDFRIEAGNDVGTVCADPQQIGQVLMNIAVNARDAMPNGGRFTITTARLDVDDAMTFGGAEVLPGSYAVITLTDTGVGMTPHVSEHLFEPFFTTKAAGVGTGLGLATVYGIVHQFGGCVGVTSAPGEGSTFTVFLPSAHGEVSSQLPAPAPSAQGSESILVADDDTAVRRVVVRVLRQAGYHVREAEDGASALALLTESDPAPALLLTDLVMPGMGGRELVHEVSARRLPVRILLMSGYSRERVEGATWPDDVAFIEKPFATAALLRRVRQVLDAAPEVSRSLEDVA